MVGHKGRNALLAFDRRGAAGLHHQGTLLAAARVFTPGGHHQAGTPQAFCGHANQLLFTHAFEVLEGHAGHGGGCSASQIDHLFRGLQCQQKLCLARRDLALHRLARAVVGHAGRKHAGKQAGTRPLNHAVAVRIKGARDAQARRRGGPPGAVAQQQLGVGTAPHQLFGDGRTQPAPEAVDDAAHAINRHGCGARGHQNALTRQRRGAQRLPHRHTQQLGPGQVVFAISVVRGHELHAKASELAGVVHQQAVVQGAVHGGRHHNAGAPLLHAADGRSQRRGNHGIGHTTGHFGDGVVGGRRHQVGVERRTVGQVFSGPGQAAHHRSAGGPLQGFAGHVAQRFV